MGVLAPTAALHEIRARMQERLRWQSHGSWWGLCPLGLSVPMMGGGVLAISGVKEAVWGHQLRGDQPQGGHALSHHSRLIPT